MSTLGLPKRSANLRARSHDYTGATIAALMWGNKSMLEITEATGISRISLRRILTALRYHGIVYIVSRARCKSDKTGGWVFGMNSVPFEYEDCEGLPAQSGQRKRIHNQEHEHVQHT